MRGHHLADRRPADVDSRSGSLYCQVCDDIVWDPTLEDLRVRKIGTGSFSGKATRKPNCRLLCRTFANFAPPGRSQEEARRTLHRLRQRGSSLYILKYHNILMSSERAPWHLQRWGDVLSECRSPELSP